MSIETVSARTLPHALNSGTLALGVFGFALFSSAFLLFWVEPLFTRVLLPHLGGSQGVWNTCLVFFQACLLLGYAYAHLLARIFPLRTQVLAHVVVLVCGTAFLPLTVAPDWAPSSNASPILPLLMLLVATLGWPFFALSANAPLLQHWFSLTGHRQAQNPYFLYAASNAGSLTALLAFPFLLEPQLTVTRQLHGWASGYWALGFVIASAGVVTLLARVERIRVVTAATERAANWRNRLIWLVYAALPSSLLLGVTGYVTTDVASFPLLWIAPLALYLATFVLTFAGRPPISHALILRLLPYAIAFAAVGFWLAPLSLVAALAVHFAAFFVIAMACHGSLAAARPPASQLTEFYFWMSLGGVVGGALTALVSPLVFHTIIEYPLALALVCLVPGAGIVKALTTRTVLLATAILVVLVEPLAPYGFQASAYLSLSAILLVGLWAFRPKHFEPRLVALALLLACQTLHTLYIRHGSVIWRDRSFYGSYIVTEDKKAGYRLMFHGTTLHGVERLNAKPVSLTYYSPRGPLGEVMRATAPRLHAIGAVGLGIGSEACYARPGQSWTFFELDGLVEQLAAKSGLFRTIGTCAPQAKFVLGDGRLNLEHVSPGRFDLLILDAFSSDAIPVHLLTREAFATDLHALAPHGVIAVHITNRFFDLSSIIARTARDVGLIAYDRDFEPPKGTDWATLAPSHWMVLARSAADAGAIAGDKNWRLLPASPKTRLWSDDYSNVLAALK